MTELESPTDARELRKLGHQAVTEGVNLKYVERMRQALYAAADRIEELEAGQGFQPLTLECGCALRLFIERGGWEWRVAECCEKHSA